jgi:hypothetical protein
MASVVVFFFHGVVLVVVVVLVVAAIFVLMLLCFGGGGLNAGWGGRRNKWGYPGTIVVGQVGCYGQRIVVGGRGTFFPTTTLLWLWLWLVLVLQSFGRLVMVLTLGVVLSAVG